MLDELDPIAVGIFDEGNHRAAMRHRAGWSRDFDTRRGETLAGLVNVRHANREVAKGATQIVRLGLVPIVGQLDHSIAGLVAIPNKSECKFSRWVIAFAQDLHAEQIAVEI